LLALCEAILSLLLSLYVLSSLLKLCLTRIAPNSNAAELLRSLTGLVILGILAYYLVLHAIKIGRSSVHQIALLDRARQWTQDWFVVPAITAALSNRPTASTVANRRRRRPIDPHESP
jgi:hypothetical protein